MKVGIYGGGFDPPHAGHINAAKSSLDFLGLDLLYIVPAFISPLKSSTPAATPGQRLEMCRIAFSFNKRIKICDFEIKREEISYTADTIKHFLDIYPKGTNTLYLIFGTDQLRQLDRWRNYNYIIENAVIAVVSRFKEGIDTAEVEKYKALGANIVLVDMEEIEVSSTDIRNGKNISLLDSKVKEYVDKNGLYK